MTHRIRLISALRLLQIAWIIAKCNTPVIIALSTSPTSATELCFNRQMPGDGL
jgi:hypothetical protein